MKLRVRPQIFLQHVRWYLGKSLSNLALRIIKPPKNARVDRTSLDTRRSFIPHDAVVAPRAFVSISRVVIDEAYSVRASLNAISATDTDFRVNQLHAFRRCQRGMSGTNLIARRVFALIAQLRNEIRAINGVCIDLGHVRSGISTFRYLVDLNRAVLEMDIAFYPCSVLSLGHIVFDSAG